MSVNKVFLMGRLTKDPELKTTQSGVSMCRFSIAVDRYSKGEDKQTDFFDILAWRQQAEFVSKYFTKGRMIHVEGSLRNNNYTDQNGVKHYATAIDAYQVNFCGDKQNDPNSQQYRPSAQYAHTAQQTSTPQNQTQGVQQKGQQNNVQLGDLSDFIDITNTDEVPF